MATLELLYWVELILLAMLGSAFPNVIIFFSYTWTGGKYCFFLMPVVEISDPGLYCFHS